MVGAGLGPGGAQFAPDGALQTMMSAPVVGREAFAERVRLLSVGLDRIAIRIKPIRMIRGRVCVDHVSDVDMSATTARCPGSTSFRLVAD